MKAFELAFVFFYISLPFFVGVSREWTPMLRPRGFVFAIFVHAVLLATVYCSKFHDQEFFLVLMAAGWLNLTLYGAGRLIVIAAQGRFWNWVDSLTPEQQLARILIVASILTVYFGAPKIKQIRDSQRDQASIQTGFNHFLRR